MHPKSHERISARTFTFRVAFAFAVAAALTFVPLSAPRAQHSGHQGHQGHEGHERRPAKTKTPSGKKAPAKKRSSHVGHGQHGATVSGVPATREYMAAHESMMRNMAMPYTGDADVDFRVQMIPHHQGAIDMARVAMRHAKDPWTRQLAESVIVEQQREIAEMQAWLARRGATVPPGGQPHHIISADSYRTVPEEPGTPAELLGKSWAPGSGVPAQRP